MSYDINQYIARSGRTICEDGSIINIGDVAKLSVPHTITIVSGITVVLTKIGGISLLTFETLTNGDHVYMDDVISTAEVVTGADSLGGGLYRVGGTDVSVTAVAQEAGEGA